MNNIKIGYQGIKYSNSFFIAKQFVKENGIKDYKFIPLTNSANVYNNLIEEKINYGIMAIYNTIGGEVIETKEVLKNNKLLMVHKYDRKIKHCLFKKSKDIEIICIASHIQALKQTKNVRTQIYPNLKELIVEDTALAAQQLKEGILDEKIGIICTKEAGINNGLFLVCENFQDMKENITTFGVFEKIR